MTCEKLAACPFFNDRMPIDSGMGNLLKKRYCEGDNRKCARYLVCTKLGKEHVPGTMYPNMLDKAQQILTEHGITI